MGSGYSYSAKPQRAESSLHSQTAVEGLGKQASTDVYWGVAIGMPPTLCWRCSGPYKSMMLCSPVPPLVKGQAGMVLLGQDTCCSAGNEAGLGVGGLLRSPFQEGMHERIYAGKASDEEAQPDSIFPATCLRS